MAASKTCFAVAVWMEVATKCDGFPIGWIEIRDRDVGYAGCNNQLHPGRLVACFGRDCNGFEMR